MHRFYVSPDRIVEGRALIRDEEYKHLAKVLRLVVGDPVIVFDGLGLEYAGVIQALDSQEALIMLETPLSSPRESPLELWLIQGLAKGDKMDLIIQKTTELGIRGIIPLEAARSVVRLDDRKKQDRVQRWQKVALEAAKQCQRAWVPHIGPVSSLDSVLKTIPEDALLLIPWEEGGRRLKHVLQEASQEARSLDGSKKRPVYFIIGPEGGLEAQEVQRAERLGGIAVTLGPRILRTETAGLVTAALLMYEWGDLGGC